MKDYTLNKDEVWFSIPNVPISLNDLEVLRNGTSIQQKKIINEINKKREKVLVEGEELKLCNDIYSKYKPKLNDNDIYKLISFDFTTDGITFLGSYNYMLNKQPIHIQIK